MLDRLRAFWTERRAEVDARFRRTLPFGDYVVDRWEKAKALGFGEGTSIYDSALVLGDVSVGRDTWIGPGVVLDGSGGLSIGSNCSISAGVQVYSHDSVRWAVSGGAEPHAHAPTAIGDHCYIGPNSVIAKGVTIGDRCVVGAGSVVLDSLPAGTRAAGAPCRPLRDKPPAAATEAPGTSPVVLGPIRDADTQDLFAWINDRDTVIFNAPYRPVHEGGHKAWFAAVTARPDIRIFAIRDALDDALVGTCQLSGIDPVARAAELQIRIGASSRRDRGHGSAAVRALVAYGFRDLGLNRIYLTVFASNARAREVYRRTGFVEEGVARQAAFIDGAYQDIVMMAILAGDAGGAAA